ncbi:hypothetical protein EVAR_86585_1 [Eumeta japonica]|uniref:Uncharacterized protein n=1 Tax=Eumeta variegata TaxID=151549 RepID=A0A4C1W1R5_EUMVA|nr:hypothetical protein EVAR_86585_1 [Eumeta japonica]
MEPAPRKNQTRFNDWNKHWLDAYISFFSERSSKSRGNLGDRPTKDFVESSDCMKCRKTRNLRTQYTSSELTFAEQMESRSERNLEDSKIVRDIAIYGPESLPEQVIRFLDEPEVVFNE